MARRIKASAAEPEATQMPGFIGPQLATEGAFGSSVDSRNQIRWLPHPAPHRRRGSAGLRAQWLQLDQQVSRIAGAFDFEGQAIVDGEVVVIHEGRTNFSELQADLRAEDLRR